MPITKSELRKEYRNIRNMVPEAVRCSESRRVCERVVAGSLYRESDAVFCYISYGSELETDSLIQRALKDGKTVAVPVIQGKNMFFCRIHQGMEYQRNEYGIPEPVEKEPVEPEGFSSVLLIVPGLCYDKQGGRIGYGGGYYDRYIDKYGRTAKFQMVSLALSCQFYEGCIPMEEHDIRPDKIFYPI